MEDRLTLSTSQSASPLQRPSAHSHENFEPYTINKDVWTNATNSEGSRNFQDLFDKNLPAIVVSLE